ncbi:MAG: DUF1697 domain-containing protein, partial [Acidobacteriota bacterium]
MTKYAALIRGIGPGDPNMANDKLRGVLEALGFSGVKSVISSGNIIFESEITDVGKLESIIEAAWPKHLGFERSTIVKSQEQFQKLLDSDPFNGAPHGESSYLLITFFKKPTKLGFDLPYQPTGKPYTVIGYANNAM